MKGTGKPAFQTPLRPKVAVWLVPPEQPLLIGTFWLTWGVAPRCTAILQRRRRIQRYRSLTRLTDSSYPTLLIHPDGRLSHTWPPRATPIPPPPRCSPETGGRQIRIPNPNLPPVLEPSNRTHPSVPKCPPSHKRGFEFSPPSLGPISLHRSGRKPSRADAGENPAPKYPLRLHHSLTVPRRGATAPKCRLALPLAASTDALPKQGRSRSEVRRIACLAKHQQPAPTQPTHTTPTLSQWEFAAALPANNTTRRSGLASGLFALSAAWGEEAVNNKHTHPHRHFTIPPLDFPPERVLPFPTISSILFFVPTPDNIYYFPVLVAADDKATSPGSILFCCLPVVCLVDDDSHGAPHPPPPPHPLGHLRLGVLSSLFSISLCVCVLHGPVAWSGILWVGFSVGGRSVGKNTFIIIIGSGREEHTVHTHTRHHHHSH